MTIRRRYQAYRLAIDAYTGGALDALKVEAKQFAALNADDGSAIVTKSDVFRLNVGGEIQTFSPLANEINRTDSELELVYVGQRDMSAKLGVAEVKGENTLQLSGDAGPLQPTQLKSKWK